MLKGRLSLALMVGLPALLPVLLCLAEGPGTAITACLIAGYAVAFGIDNLVVVSPYVRKLSSGWQFAYRSVGLVVALLVQLALPLVAGAVLTGHGIGEMFAMLVTAPGRYSAVLEQIHPEVAAFGAAFMAAASVWTLTNAEREHVWLPIENVLRRHANVWRATTLIAIAGVSAVGAFWYSWPFAVAGFAGIAVFFGIEIFKHVIEGSEGNTGNGRKNVPGWKMLALIEAIEAVFSLDTGIGSLSLSSNVVVIVVGLLAGILLMRSLNVRLSKGGRLTELIHLEAGAYWTMLILALQLVVGLTGNVPDWTGMAASTVIIGAAAAHSALHARNKRLGERHA
ncbi:DUF475 domain-containing protein [Actinoallomurus sp. NPDC050550]|uniref:DUF475 domain-containing protein n=1 Tax=Actinoallomurus sp. NPDC050550 TaxID=3154937 RepID=UPI0033CDE1BB